MVEFDQFKQKTPAAQSDSNHANEVFAEYMRVKEVSGYGKIKKSI